MIKSEIIKTFLEYKCSSMRRKEKHEKEYDDIVKLNDAMLEKIGDDEEFKKLFEEFDLALNNLNTVDIEEIFKEGFLFGARLAMEICGVECE